MNGHESVRQNIRGVEIQKKKNRACTKPGFIVTEINESPSTSQMQRSRRRFTRFSPCVSTVVNVSDSDSSEVQSAVTSSPPLDSTMDVIESDSEPSSSVSSDQESSVVTSNKIEMKRKHRNSTSESQEDCMVTKVDDTPAITFKSIGPKKFKVYLLPGAKFYFHGKLSVKVVEGHVKVLGWTMKEGETRQVFSPQSSSLLGLENGTENSTIVLQPFDSHLASALHKLVQQQLFSTCRESDLDMLPAKKAKVQAERSLQCRFITGNTPSSSKVTLVGDDWQNVIHKIIHDAIFTRKRTVLAGGKGVGKSTLLRVLANSMLTRHPGVLVLDFDPGQAEFTPPGCLSATLVTNPLLGPGYTQQRTPERMMFLGNIDVSRCRQEFLDAAEELVQFCTLKHPRVPWLVNTMGFNTGLGEQLMADILRMLGKEVQVVEVRSRHLRKNYPPKLWAAELSVNSHHCISCMAEHSQGNADQPWGLLPRDLREISLLAYLSPALHQPSFSISPCEPYKISLEQLTLGAVQTKDRIPPSELLRALVGNLVGLCQMGPEAATRTCLPNGSQGPRVLWDLPVALPCVGYGLVTGVDQGEGRLYLQTPEPVERLAEVNCLVLGAVELPSVLRTLNGTPGEPTPYTTIGKEQPMSSPAKRYFRPFSSLTPSKR